MLQVLQVNVVIYYYASIKIKFVLKGLQHFSPLEKEKFLREGIDCREVYMRTRGFVCSYTL